MAMGHLFDGKATLVIGTHTHVPTSDHHILKGGTAYQTDAGMCGDYDSVIGMNKDNSLNRFMKKCDDVFKISKEFLEKYDLKKDYDFLIVDFHGEITSEKNAIGHYFDGKATLVIGTHTHIPTNDARILNNGTAYQTDAGMCGDYDSVIGMNKDNSLNRFMKKDSIKHFPAVGEASLSGVIVNCNLETGLADNIESYIFGGLLKNT